MTTTVVNIWNYSNRVTCISKHHFDTLQPLCFQCGAIPCPYTHEDKDKKQRLADLEFVKELAKERREFKQEMDKVSQGHALNQGHARYDIQPEASAHAGSFIAVMQ